MHRLDPMFGISNLRMVNFRYQQLSSNIHFRSQKKYSPKDQLQGKRELIYLYLPPRRQHKSIWWSHLD